MTVFGSLPTPHFPALRPVIPELAAVSPFDALLNYPPIKALIPIPIFLLLAPAIWYLFRGTWKEIDEEARLHRQEQSGPDYRAIVCLVTMAVVLTMQDYYGGSSFFSNIIEPVLRDLEAHGRPWLQVDTYQNLYSYSWWAFARIFGYAVVPLVFFKLCFPGDSILDMGLRTRGFLSHLWIYGLCLGAVLFAMILLSGQKEFLNYYPFYKHADRSWFDLLVWEAAYFAQFFALEFYFRGFVLHSLRSRMGSTAIFVMAVPYCMIHYGKPYLEAHGAIVAGIALGSLAMRTRSIYAGFLVHITVAGLMDYFALVSRNGLPTRFWP